jgi:PleD family two-component response regulator
MNSIMPGYIIAAIDDLFFASKIRATGESLGVEVKFVRNADAAMAAAKERRPDLIIVNLQADYALNLARTVGADADLKLVPLLGFYSHVETELQQQAREAGYTNLLPRSAFTARLPEILLGNL